MVKHKRRTYFFKGQVYENGIAAFSYKENERQFSKTKPILERKCAANEQYSRRECLEISGIPESIPNDNLEETVLKIFNETGVTVNSRGVESCH